jgi:hypothetical protein
MPPEVSPQSPEEARDRRRQKLFGRWSQGGRLSAGEREEVADLISAAGAPLLESQPAIRPGSYMRTYEWYAENLGWWPPEVTVASRVRTLKRWVHEGRARTPQDFPPFDQPAQMGAWLLRVKSRRLKAWDPIFAQAEPPGSGIGPTPPPTSPATKDAEAGLTIDFASLPATSSIENLDAMRRAVAGAFRLYSEAMLHGRADADQRQRAYRELSAELRKAENDSESLREARGELIPRDRLVAEARRVHSAMAGALRAELAARQGMLLTSEAAAEIVTAFFRPLRAAEFGLGETLPGAA